MLNLYKYVKSWNLILYLIVFLYYKKNKNLSFNAVKCLFHHLKGKNSENSRTCKLVITNKQHWGGGEWYVRMWRGGGRPQGGLHSSPPTVTEFKDDLQISIW